MLNNVRGFVLQNSESIIFTVVKSVVMAVIISLISILIFAFIVKVASLSSGTIKAVNQFIKVIALFLGCFTFINGSRGAIKGAIIGVFYILLLYLLFYIFGSGEFGIGFFIDLICCSIVGVISGIISVNIRR